MNKVFYKGDGAQSSERGPSPSIWSTCPWMDIQGDPNVGYAFFDDFLEFGLPGTQTTQINLGKYKVYNTGSGEVITDAVPHDATPMGEGGIISMLCDTAGDQSVIGTHACPYSLSSSSGKLWFEARVACTSIATATSHWFVGLGNNCDVTFGAAIPLADADATGTAVALIGFNRLEDGLAVLNASYTDEAAVYTDVKASIGTLAANTWIKVGFVYDPADTTNTIRFFVNGTPSVTVMSAATLAALTHLDASGLGPIFAAFADTSGTAEYHYLDWWRVAQLA